MFVKSLDCLCQLLETQDGGDRVVQHLGFCGQDGAEFLVGEYRPVGFERAFPSQARRAGLLLLALTLQGDCHLVEIGAGGHSRPSFVGPTLSSASATSMRAGSPSWMFRHHSFHWLVRACQR